MKKIKLNASFSLKSTEMKHIMGGLGGSGSSFCCSCTHPQDKNLPKMLTFDDVFASSILEAQQNIEIVCSGYNQISCFRC